MSCDPYADRCTVGIKEKKRYESESRKKKKKEVLSIKEERIRKTLF